MILMETIEQLSGMDIGKVKFNEPLSAHTTWKIGGRADALVIPNSIDQVVNVVLFAKEQNIPLQVLGGGSNVLVSDQGLRGITVKIGGGLKDLTIDRNMVRVQAGVPIPYLAQKVAKSGLSGLEFASGIPGTVGGAIVMNAGANGSQMSDVVRTITCCDRFGNIKVLSNVDANFSYRYSRFKEETELIILEIEMVLEQSNQKLIIEKMKEYAEGRKNKQPLEWPSAGSVFKNPPNQSAGRLIESIGAKGWQVGQAQVSHKHANFIVNLGGATAADVATLMEKVRNGVWEKYEIMLESEVLFLR